MICSTSTVVEPSSPVARGGVAPVLGRLLPPILLLGLLLILHLILLDPYELTSDEAHYWEWARHLDWSYYSKGPGVAWVIALFTGVLGDHVWAIRLPAVLALLTAALAVAAAGARFQSAIHGNRAHRAAAAGSAARTARTAALIWVLTPAFFAVGHFMTIDAPMLAGWALAVAGIAHWRQSGDDPRASARWAVMIGLAIGAAALFKYTALLLLPGLVLAACLDQPPRPGPGNGPVRPKHHRGRDLIIITAGAALALMPVFIWNAQRDWPTVHHLLGHLNAPGGDVHAKEQPLFNPLWTLEYLAGQFAILGPPVWALILFTTRLAYQRRRSSPRAAAHWATVRFLLALGAPVFLIYFAVSFFTDVEANWALGAYVPLLIIPALHLDPHLRRYRRLVSHWQRDPRRPRPKRGLLRRKPETPIQAAWHWTLCVGVIAALVILFAPLLSHLPGGAHLPGLDRIHGNQAWAQRIAAFIPESGDDQGRPPLLIADHYGKASLLAFYLPNHPRVFSAASLMGSRRSSYDFFADTNLRNPDLHGRPALLIGATPQRWTDALGFSTLRILDRDDQVYRVTKFTGPHPRTP